MDKKDEFNLDEFKDLLNDVPDAGDFDLESIIAEVEGRAPAEPKAEPGAQRADTQRACPCRRRAGARAATGKDCAENQEQGCAGRSCRRSRGRA